MDIGACCQKLVGLTTSPLVLANTGLVLAPKNDARKLTLFVFVSAGRGIPIADRKLETFVFVRAASGI